jgi:hypothetical protein
MTRPENDRALAVSRNRGFERQTGPEVASGFVFAHRQPTTHADSGLDVALGYAVLVAANWRRSRHA